MVSDASEFSGMSYGEATEWLFGQRRSGRKRELKRVQHLLGQMGDPEKRFRSIHVTGTNGKGSTTAMVASILKAAGYRVGMFTSPHLSSFSERIVVDGEQIPADDVVRIVEEIMPLANRMSRDPEIGHLSFFEITTSIAFKYFAEREVDFAVLEAGMGGRVDATNIVHSLISVITNVSLEHTDTLGKTTLEIAKEKAGIIKDRGVLITATEDDGVFSLFKEICDRKRSKIFRVGSDIVFRKLSSSMEGQTFQLNGLVNRFDELFVPLLGDHQLLNAASAVGTVEALSFHDISIPLEAIGEGLREVKWPGRLEIMQTQPLVVVDCAKDAEGARVLKETLRKEFVCDKLIMVVSVSSDKNIPAMIDQLAEVANQFIITSHSVMGRAADPVRIAEEVERHSKPYEIVTDAKTAVRRALEISSRSDMICVTGSVFLVGETRELWTKTSNHNESS
jgi:dihydrofolate synthase/folylpolyglutamate synthase